jgi:hypothetical protein
VADEISDALAVPPPLEVSDDYGPSSPRWRDQSLSKDAAGVAVLHGVRAQEDLGGGNSMHGVACPRHPRGSQRRTSRYLRAMTSLDAGITQLVHARLEAALARMAAAVRPSLSEFDLVRGLTGLGAYLLHRDPHGDLVRRVLAYLVRLTEPIPADDATG